MVSESFRISSCSGAIPSGFNGIDPIQAFFPVLDHRDLMFPEFLLEFLLHFLQELGVSGHGAPLRDPCDPPPSGKPGENRVYYNSNPSSCKRESGNAGADGGSHLPRKAEVKTTASTSAPPTLLLRISPNAARPRSQSGICKQNQS